MGCASSRLEDSEVIMQCKERRRLMKNAVSLRQEFAIAHVAYIQTLRNVGFALRKFAEGSTSEPYTTPSTPGTPVLPLPQPTPDVAVLSPPSELLPPPPALSPPRPSSPPPAVTLPSPVKVVSPPRSLLPTPTSSPSSADTSPMAHSSPPSRSENSSPPARLEVAPSNSSLQDVASPGRASDSSPPFYYQSRSDTDAMFMTFSPSPRGIRTPLPPPSPPPASTSSWFLYDIFNAPPIPYHLQEHRRMKEFGEVEEDVGDIGQDFDHVREEEGIPDLEEEEQKEEAKENPVQPEPELKREDISRMAEEKTVVVEEKSGEATGSSAKPDAGEKVNSEEDQVVVVANTEPVVTPENEKNDKPKNELSVVTSSKGLDLTGVVRHIDGHFARACKSGKDVSGMLETQMVPHQMNILDVKESSKMFNAITWHWSRKTSVAMRDAYDDSDVAECGMTGSHASTLERIYAWEKKLYDEVKAGEYIRLAFDRKCRQLHNLVATGVDTSVVDKTRAALKKLDTQLMVALRAIHLASVKIQELTKDELFPQLAELLSGLMSMWKVMLECHKAQKAIALEMESLKNSVAGDEASEAHRRATVELEHELETWQMHFQQWICSQKKYIYVLHQWLSKCHLVSDADIEGREMVSSHSADGFPPIQALLENWYNSLVRLEKQQEVVDAISNFAAVVHSLEMEQSDELGLKRQAERSAKDLDRRSSSFRKLEQKYGDSSEDSDGKSMAIELHSSEKGGLHDRKASLHSFRSMVEEDKQKLHMAVQGRRDTTLSRLQGNLPTVFESMASFAADALKEYEKLQLNVANGKFPARQNGIHHHTFGED